jgi:hypothetical protein
VLYIPQVWEYQQDYPSHLPSDEALGIQAINVKTHDGVSWQGLFDNHPAEVADILSWKRLVSQYAASGIEAFPWCVPTGREINAEIHLASLVLEVTPRMVFDVEAWEAEPYYWKGSVLDIHTYMGALRKRFPGARFTLQYDSRWPQNIHLAEWLPYVDDLCGMDYWVDFKQSVGTTLDRAAQRMSAFGKPWAFTFPGTGSESDYRYGEEVARHYGHSEIYIFRRGNMTPGVVSRVQANRQVPEVVVNPPVEPEGPTQGNPIDDLYHEQVRQALRLEGVEAKLSGLIASLKGLGASL